MTSSQIANSLHGFIRGNLLLIIFLPLLVVDQLLFPFIFPRTVAFRILVELSVVAYLVLATLRPAYRLPRAPILICVGLFVSVLLITGLSSPDPFNSFWSTVERSEGVILWLHLLGYLVVLVGTMRTKEDWSQLFSAGLIAGWIHVVYGLGQYFNLPFAITTGGQRLGGSIGNASFFATYLLFVIFIAARDIITTQRPWRKITSGLLLIGCFFLIWHTQTRGAVIALAIGVLWYSITIVWRRIGHRIWIPLGSIALLCALGAGFIISNVSAPWIQRYPTLYRLATISSHDITTQNRLIVWGAAWRALVERPIAGWGLENFSIAFNAHFDPAITRDIGSNPWYDRVHNMPLEIAVASGVIGLALYVALLALAWRATAAIHSYRERTAVRALLLAYCIQNLFVFDTISSYIYAGMIFSWLASCGISSRPQPSVSSNTESKLYRIGAGIAMIVLIPVLYSVNLRPLLANHAIIQAVVHHKEQPEQSLRDFKRAMRFYRPGDEEPRYILTQYARDQLTLRNMSPESVAIAEYALQEMQQTVRANPESIQGYVLLSELYLALSSLQPNATQTAIEVMQSALAKSPRRYQIYTTLGRLMVHSGNYDQAITYFQQATQLNDKFAEAHWNLAIAYILADDHPRADAELATTYELGFDIYQPQNINRLMQAYRDAGNLTALHTYLQKIVQRMPENAEYQKELRALELLFQQVRTTNARDLGE